MLRRLDPPDPRETRRTCDLSEPAGRHEAAGLPGQARGRTPLSAAQIWRIRLVGRNIPLVKRVASTVVQMSLWKRAALAFVLVLCAAIALAPSTGPSKRIPNGVRITGVNVSGLDAGQARQVISARFGAPLRFRFDQREWTASPRRLGMHADIEGSVSRALNASTGDDIGVSVDVNRDKVRSYVSKLDDQFGIDPANAVVTGLVNGRPQIADSKWGREVRRQTMVRAIVRTLRTRIRPALPLVTKTLKP
jgi:hypothetical protein